MEKIKCKICGQYKPVSMFRCVNSRCNDCRKKYGDKVSQTLKQKGIDKRNEIENLKTKRDEELEKAKNSKTIEEYREHQRNADYLYYKIQAKTQKIKDFYLNDTYINLK